MSMVIHHGGSGTSAFGLRAGVPSCIVPFVFDQYYWGERIAQLGVGPKPIPYKKLTVNRLREAIETSLHSTEIKRNAEELGHKIGSENGTGKAIRIVENLTSTTQSRSVESR